MTASKLGTKTRSGGIRQVTYGGKPLYFFVGDTGTGQVNGNMSDEWGKWAAVVTRRARRRARANTGTTAGSGGTAF